MRTKKSTVEVARLLGISRQTLQTWIARGQVSAPEISVGGATVRMWSAMDIRRARKFKGTLKRGPKGPRK